MAKWIVLFVIIFITSYRSSVYSQDPTTTVNPVCVDKCYAGSTCSVSWRNQRWEAECSCAVGRMGPTCQYDNPCMSNPCLNGATCTPNTNRGWYTCSCGSDYRFLGKHCEFDFNGKNLALNKPVIGNGVVADRPLSRLTDGSRATNPAADCAATALSMEPWFMVDLGSAKRVGWIIIVGQKASSTMRNKNLEVRAWNSSAVESPSELCVYSAMYIHGGKTKMLACDSPTSVVGRYIGVTQLLLTEPVGLTYAEFEIYEDACGSNPCTNGRCESSGVYYYCSCDVWNFGPMCEYTLEVDSFQQLSRPRFEKLVDKSQLVTLTVPAECTIRQKGANAISEDTCKERASIMKADYFMSDGGYCEILTCTGSLYRTMSFETTGAGSGYDIWRRKTFSMIDESIYNDQYKSDRYSAGFRVELINSLSDITHTDITSYKTDRKEDRPKVRPPSMTTVTGTKLKSSCSVRRTYTNSGSINTAEKCLARANLLFYDESNLVSFTENDGSQGDDKVCRIHICSGDDMKLEVSTATFIMYQRIHLHEYINQRLYGWLFPRLSFTELMTWTVDQTMQTTKEYLFYDLKPEVTAKIIGIEYHALAPGSFKICYWKLVSTSYELQKSAEIVVGTAGHHKESFGPKHQYEMTSTIRFSIWYPDSGSPVIPYYTSSSSLGNYKTRTITVGSAGNTENRKSKYLYSSSYIIPGVRLIAVDSETSACTMNPCRLGSSCSDESSGFKCTCNQQSEGDLCDDLNNSPACDSDPCLNNGTCKTSGSIFSCNCTGPFSGTTCENADYCYNDPCLNGATCTSGNNKFTCTCLTSFTGDKCETFMDVCYSSPCVNGGTCSTPDNTTVVCTCSSTYIGDTCQIENFCGSNPCQNGGDCNNTATGYTCTCTPPYTGTDCETADYCMSEPCQNDGTCSSSSLNFTCSCAPTYNGSICEEELKCTMNYTVTQTWKCIRYFDEFATWQEAEDTCKLYHGNLVSVPNQETHNDIKAVILHDYNVLQPEEGDVWIGLNDIETEGTPIWTDNTAYAYKRYHGSEPNNRYPGYTDADCFRMYRSSASTAWRWGDKPCDRKARYICQTEMRVPCSKNPCQNGGSCSATNAGDEQCACAPGYSGPICNSGSACSSDPCQNGGTCSLIDIGFHCECPSNYIGDTCEKFSCISVQLPTDALSITSPMAVSLKSDLVIEPIVSNSCPTRVTYRWSHAEVTNGIVGRYTTVTGYYYDYGDSANLKYRRWRLEVGVFALKIEVLNMDVEAVLYYSAQKAKLVAIIEGGAVRTVTKGDTIYLYASRKSHDPDSTYSTLTYSWSCKTGDHRPADTGSSASLDEFSRSDCPPALQSMYTTSRGYLRFDSDRVSGKITVRVKVSRDTRKSFFDQVINVVEDFVPKATVTCVRNCQTIVMPTSPLSLMVNCTGCKTLDMSYAWFIDIKDGSTYNSVNITGKTMTDPTQPGFALKTWELSEGSSFRVSVNLSCATCLTSTAEYTFYTNVPPSGGSCVSRPSEGRALNTTFRIQCSGWSSGSDPKVGPSPLTYRFQLRTTKSAKLLYFGTLPMTPNFPLMAGEESDDYNVTVSVVIADSYGAATTVNVTTKVTTPPVAENGDASSAMENALASVDVDNPKSGSMYLQSVSGSLNKQDGSASAASAKKLRTKMVGLLDKMSDKVESVNDAVQAMGALSSITEVGSEMEEDSVTVSTQVVSKLITSAFAILANDSEETENVVRASLPAVFNIVSATKPKTDPVQDTPRLETPEEEAARKENDPLSPEERLYYDKLNKKNREEEKKKAEAAAGEMLSLMGSVSSALLGTLVPGQDPVTVQTDKATLSVVKKKASDLKGLHLGSSETGKISLPSDLVLPGGPDAVLDVSATSYKTNPYTWGATSEEIGSGVSSITIADDTGSPISLDASLTAEFINQQKPSSSTVNMEESKDELTGMIIHKVNITAAGSSIVMELDPPGSVDRFSLFVRHLYPPTNTTYNLTWVASRSSTGGSIPIFVSGDVTGQPGLYYIGLRPIYTAEGRRKRSANGADDSYGLKMSTAGCRVWDDSKGDWVMSSDVDSSGTSLTKTTCPAQPSPQSSNFAASVIAPPNMIDFSTVFAKFADLSNNPLVFSVIISIVSLWMLLMIWAIREDRKDLRRWEVLPLVDDSTDDKFQYRLCVQTGINRGAGTKSNVFFILYGHWGDTGIRPLKARSKSEFILGSMLNFSLRTPVYMGRINSIKIWHDNTGGDWYLDNVTVEDLYEGIVSVFTVKSWFSSKTGDGRLCRVFPVTTSEERRKFSYMYKKTVAHRLTDTHLWLSVFLRPSPSNFTRAQRLTCCVALLFLSMITSAMFYKTEDNVERPMQLEIGPFSFSTQELFVSVITVLICLPPSLFIVQIFRWSNKKKLDNIVSPDYDPFEVKIDDEFDDIKRTNRYIPDTNHRRPTNVMAKRYDNRETGGEEEEVKIKENGKKKVKIKELPGWVVYIGWAVAVLSILVPGFFVILYSLQWGAEKANAWFSAYCLSFFENVLVSDPSKVMVVALIATVILYRSSADEKDYDNTEEQTMKAKEDMTPEELAKVKKLAMLESRATAALKELLIHLVYTALVICITYSACDSQSYFAYKTMNNMVTKSFYKKVENQENFFMWLNDYFIPNYFVIEDINNNTLHWRERKFMSDRASFRVGPARLRQLRVVTSECPVPILINRKCYGEFDVTQEETASFGPETIRNDTEGNTYFTNKAWFHTPSIEVMGEPFMGRISTYSGGGYLAKLDLNRQTSLDIIKELQDNLWVDRQTRAVLLEFSTYNPNVQLFTFTTIGLEIPNSAGPIHFVSISVLRAYSMGFFTVFSYFCLLVTTIYSIGSFILEVKAMVKLRGQYVKSAKNWLSVVSFLTGLSMASIFIVRMVIMTAVLTKMKENLNEYVQFRRVALYDEIYKFLVALLATVCILKIILLLRLNKRIGEFVGTVQGSAVGLLNFVIIAFGVLMAFTGLIHYWYRSLIYEMRSPSSTMAALVSISLGDFEAKGFTEQSPIFTALAFTFYMAIMNVLMLNLLTTILMESQVAFHQAKQYHCDDHLVGEFMIKKFFGGLQSSVAASMKVDE